MPVVLRDDLVIFKILGLAALLSISVTLSATAQTSIQDVSSEVEKMFSGTSSTSDRGKLFVTTSEVDATSVPCKIRFTDTTTIDGEPFVRHVHTIDAARISFDSLTVVPSYMEDAPADLLEKAVWLVPSSGTFTFETERFGEDRELLFGSGGVCDDMSCRESMQVYLHVIVGNDPTGHRLISDLSQLCKRE